MEKQEYTFSNKKVRYYFDSPLEHLNQLVDPDRCILIVDDKVDRLYKDRLKGWKKIIVEGSEKSKQLSCFQEVVDKLIDLEADRKTILIGIGGGVVTDLTGFVASVYMRGIDYAFVPTTLLAQVDASVGGKNGINYSRYKNILGIIRQPEFLLFDYDLLDTLDAADLHNGFAEIIKYACIWDKDLLTYLEDNQEKALARDKKVLAYLVKRSVEIKSKIVQEDEFEGGLRRLLNFGHTIGHAVEKIENIAHGKAVAKGMLIAAQLSSKLSGLQEKEVQRLNSLIQNYHLPVTIQAEVAEIEALFKMDKKREKDFIHFILLKELGKAEVVPISLVELSELLTSFIKK